MKLLRDGKRTTGLRAHLKNFGRKGDDFGVDWDGRPLSLGEYQWNNLEKSLKTELRKILTEKLGVTQSVASFNIEPVGYDAKTGDFTAIVAKAVLLDDGAKAAAAPVKKASVAAAPAPSSGFFGLFGGGGALFGRQPSCKNVAASDGVELLSGANADDGRPRTLTTGSVKVSEQSNKVWYDWRSISRSRCAGCPARSTASPSDPSTCTRTRCASRWALHAPTTWNCS